jgi:hypothetical protein
MEKFDSTVSKFTRHVLDDQGSIPGMSRVFSLRHHIQFYNQQVPEILSLGVKRPDREINYSPPP